MSWKYQCYHLWDAKWSCWMKLSRGWTYQCDKTNLYFYFAIKPAVDTVAKWVRISHLWQSPDKLIRMAGLSATYGFLSPHPAPTGRCLLFRKTAGPRVLLSYNYIFTGEYACCCTHIHRAIVVLQELPQSHIITTASLVMAAINPPFHGTQITCLEFREDSGFDLVLGFAEAAPHCKAQLGSAKNYMSLWEVGRTKDFSLGKTAAVPHAAPSCKQPSLPATCYP